MQHVLWIGGPSAVGKTTVATSLARRYGLRLYSADTRTWAHRDRAVREAIPAAVRWESLSPVERWNGHSAAELLDMSLHRERGQMVVDDLASLPTSPLVVAEGTVLPAWAVTAGSAQRSRAIWLIPTQAFHDQQLAARGMAGEPLLLYQSLRGVIQQEAREHGVATLALDGSQDAATVYQAVEQLFEPELTSGPTATRALERGVLLREANLAIVGQVRGFYARPWAEGDPDIVVRSFSCECGSVSCAASLVCSVGEAANAPVLAPGHH